jgi:hypothetical protein
MSRIWLLFVGNMMLAGRKPAVKRRFASGKRRISA